MIKSLGIIYASDNIVAQTGITTTPVKMSGAQHGKSVEMGPDVVGTSIHVRYPGDYVAIMQISFSGSANTLFTFHLYKNGVISPFGTHRKLSGGDAGSCSILGIFLGMERGDYIDVYVTSDNGSGASIIVIDASLVLFQVN